MKKFLMLSILCVMQEIGFAQSPDIAYPHVSVMSPEAASMAVDVDYPVSLYTGVPNIDIPLYTVEVDGFQLPLNLKYHASGIRADQEASWVGLGWTLDVGARISRTIKHVDDFLENGWDRYYPYCTTGWYDGPTFSCANESLYKMVGRNDPYAWVAIERCLTTDSEPDLFFYNLPSCNGKFIFDKNKLPVLFNKEHNLKVVVNRVGRPARVQLVVYDSKGNQYVFNDEEETKLYIANKPLNCNATNPQNKFDDKTSNFVEWTPIRIGYEDVMEPGPVEPYPYTSCWCVTKIITNKNRVINFTYETENQELPTQESCEVYNSSRGANKLYTRSKVVNKALRLKNITWDFGRVEFSAGNREDIKGNAKYLSKMTVYNQNEDMVKSVSFRYSYFNEDIDNDYDYVFKRLRLDALSMNGIPNDYVFEYYGGDMPAKNTKNVDYWGYPNGRDYGDNYCVGVFTGVEKFKGVTKSANFDKSVVGTLKGIQYPTGGKSEFEYELNNFGTTFGNRTNNDLGNGIVTNPEETQWVTSRTENICVYNNYSIGEYPDFPSDTLWRFELPVKTIITITGRVENTNPTLRDPDYVYYQDPLGELYQISPTQKRYFTNVCPSVYLKEVGSTTNYDGEGDELPLVSRGYTLEPGTYEFHAYRPPKDVLADWMIVLDYQSPIRKSRSLNAESGAGLRIAKIKSDAVTKTYSYSLGTYLTEPVLYYYGNRVGDGTTGATREQCLVQVSESKAPLSTFNGGYYVGYDWVEENVEGEDNPSQITHYFINEQENEMFDESFVESPVIINYTNGLPAKVEYRCADHLMKIEKYEYKETSSDYVYAFIDRVGDFSTGNVLNYYYKVQWPQISRKQEALTYNDGGDEISTVENFVYNSCGLLAQITKTLDGDNYQTLVRYPGDFQNTVCKAMVNKNVLNEPMEILGLKNGYVVNGQKKECIDTLGMFLPKAAYKLSVTQPLPLGTYQSSYYKVKTFGKYDEKGNLVQYTERGIPVVYVWGYGGQFPIAEIQNSCYSKVYSFLGGDDVVQRFGRILMPSANEVKTFLAPILNGRLSAASVSMYTHLPMVGIESITNPFGNTMNYGYDSGNRLNSIKNMDYQQLERFVYHYK